MMYDKEYYIRQILSLLTILHITRSTVAALLLSLLNYYTLHSTHSTITLYTQHYYSVLLSYYSVLGADSYRLVSSMSVGVSQVIC